MRNCGVFEIKNIVTGQVYIGYSTDIENIQGRQFYKLRKILIRTDLQLSFNKYGEKNFEFKILEYCEKKDVIRIKQKWMDFTKCCDEKYGFNIIKNADHLGENRGKKYSTIISKSLIGKVLSEEHKMKIKIFHTGKKLSEEIKKKISKSHTGKRKNRLPDICENMNKIAVKKYLAKYYPENKEENNNEKI